MTAPLRRCEEASLNIMLLSLTLTLKGMIQNVQRRAVSRVNTSSLCVQRGRTAKHKVYLVESLASER